MHIVEEYTLADRDHIRYTATIEDPKVFTRPWKMNLMFYRRTEPNFQLLDSECYAFAWTTSRSWCRARASVDESHGHLEVSQ